MRGARGLAVLALLLLPSIAAGALAAAHAATPPKVAVVLEPGGECPDPGTLQLCEGLRRAVRETGVTAKVVAPTFRDDITDFLDLIARQGYAAVIVFGYQLRPELGDVAVRHPGVPFVMMDGYRSETTRPARNVQGMAFRTSEAAFLAGWLAAKLEQRRPGRDVVGIVAGIKTRAVDDFAVGFAAGARRAAPGVRVLTDYSNDFLDPSKCAALARRQIARGAGTVFNVAGECGLGTLAVARVAGVWGVGVDTDQSFLGPHILTSVLKRYDAGFREVLEQARAGRVATGGDTILTTRDAAVGLGRISPHVPRPLLRQLGSLQRRIAAGVVVVPETVPRRSPR